MLDTSARLRRLPPRLQTRRDWSGPDLAGRVGVPERTVRRDVDRVRQLGYPVDAAPGSGGGYRLVAGAVLPPLLFTDEEAVAVAVGLRSATLAGLSGIEETAVQALAKLEQVLPTRLRHWVQTLQSPIVPLSGPGPTADIDVLLAVASAVRDHQQLRADYRTHDDTHTRRVLEPRRIVHAGRRRYLVAWDVERADWRTFRLDRLSPRTLTGPRFTPRHAPEPDVARYTSLEISTDAYRYHCRLTVHAPAHVIADRIRPTIGVITPMDEGSCERITGSDSLDEVALYVGLLGHDILAHEPPELREHITALAARFARTAEPPSSRSQKSAILVVRIPR